MPRQLRRNQWLQTDGHLLSFPGCGRSWLQAMMSRAIQLHYGLALDDQAPELHRLADQGRDIPRILASHPGPPALSHGGWRPGRGTDRARLVPTSATVGELPPLEPVVLLVRDPRDVMAGWLQRRPPEGEPEDGHRWEELADDPESGYQDLLAFYDLWVGELEAVPRARPILTVRYEDIVADPGRELGRCLTFVGVIVSGDVIDRAVQLSPGPSHATGAASYGDVLDHAQVDDLTERMHGSRADHFGYH